MAGAGYSFSLTDEQNPSNKKPSGVSGPVQEAIRILSLRLPRVFGASSLAPGPLLGGPPMGPSPPGTLPPGRLPPLPGAPPTPGGGGGQPPIDPEILRRMLGGAFGRNLPQTPPPNPVFTPGEGGREIGPANPQLPPMPAEPRSPFGMRQRPLMGGKFGPQF